MKILAEIDSPAAAASMLDKADAMTQYVRRIPTGGAAKRYARLSMRTATSFAQMILDQQEALRTMASRMFDRGL